MNRGEDPRFYFYEAVQEALGRLHLKVEDHTEFYLVELLVKQISEPVSQEPLFSQLKEALYSTSQHEKLSKFKAVGDSALFLVGFYEEHCTRRGTSKSYVMTMGGTAYKSASLLAENEMRNVYVTLAEGFDDFVNVLDEVRDVTEAKTSNYVIRLYEKWQQTGSPSAAIRLQRQGLFPVIKTERDN